MPLVRHLANQSTPLTHREAARVLKAVQAAMAGKRGWLITSADQATGRRGTEFAIGSNGRLRFLRSSGSIQGGIVTADGTSATWTRDVVTITHLTGLAARGCDGTPRTGHLIIEYRNEGGGWIATARTRVYPASPAPLDDFLAGDGDPKSTEVQAIRGQSTRMFVADWTPPASREASGNGSQGPEYLSDDDGRTWTKTTASDAPQLIESLWVDTASFLPVQWAVMFAPRGVSAKPHTLVSIRYDERVDLRPPPGIVSPDCVP